MLAIGAAVVLPMSVPIPCLRAAHTPTEPTVYSSDRVVPSKEQRNGDARTGYACQTAFSSVAEFQLARVTSTVSQSSTSSTAQSSATAQPPVNSKSGGGSDSLGTSAIVGIVIGVISALATVVGVWIAWKYRSASPRAISVELHRLTAGL
ncbi:hypothetical protein BU16DRAFT_386451 [Lophium mytilinum]|uniref:Uncharacterized protein n=1 Tax=Lophium mytilinum TaxID=390894 RepID=A0A6A6QT20_9PEZI|nr:hypothetical protein BU16DRAFT_386451 [Lophium mytilinum]